MDYDRITDLIHLMEQSNLLEIEIMHGDFKIRMIKPHVPSTPTSSIPPTSASPHHPPPTTPQSNDTCTLNPQEVMITSPIVGTFFRASSPTTNNFVEVGNIVHVGQVLCIVEAMKLLNEIETDISGEIVAVLVENGQPVEYGQPLFIIRKPE